MSVPESAPDFEALHAFWFADVCEDPARAAARNAIWFGSDAAFDRELEARFGALVPVARAGGCDAWASSPRGALALILALDQLPRNLYRGRAEAFASDARALTLARAGASGGQLPPLSLPERAFLLMPFQHSEDLETQQESVAQFEALRREAPPAWRELASSYLDFARQHLALVERFGRFPHRNEALGRASTPQEREFLTGGGATFGQ